MHSESAPLGRVSSGRWRQPKVKDLVADIPVLCGDGQVKEFADRLLVLSDGLGVALGAMGIFAAEGTTGIKPFG